MKLVVMALCLSVLSLISLPAAAAEKFTVELEMNNGELTPPVLKVPAKTPIRIKITNTGTEPVEFESTQLRKEKVLAPGAQSSVVIQPLTPGEYKFFDEFHMNTAQGVIVAK